MSVEPDVDTARKRIQAALESARKRIGEKPAGEYMLGKFITDSDDAFKFIAKELGEAMVDLAPFDDAPAVEPKPRARKRYPKLNQEDPE